MCDSDTREQNRLMNCAGRKDVPMADLPHVRIELPLQQLNSFYSEIGQARRVLREGSPEQNVKLALGLLDKLSLAMNDASGGFLAPRNI